VYRYYTCSNCATKGKTACKGRSIPMQKLDTLVTEHLLERLFRPERVAAILASLSSARAEKEAALNGRLIALQRQVIDADDKLKRLYRLVEDGLTDLDEVLEGSAEHTQGGSGPDKGRTGTCQGAFGFSHPDRSGVDRAFRP
jgi:site-specific DNA recombinase